MPLNSPVPPRTFQRPLTVRPLSLPGVKPILRVPLGQSNVLLIIAVLPCVPVNLPPWQNGALPREDPVRTSPLSTTSWRSACTLITIFWLLAGRLLERSPVPPSSPQAASPAVARVMAKGSAWRTRRRLIAVDLTIPALVPPPYDADATASRLCWWTAS